MPADLVSISNTELQKLKPYSIFNGSNYFYKMDPYIAEINSKGFRDSEHEYNNEKSKKRILLLGDSFTFGYGLNYNETLQNQLDTLLNNASEKYDLLNFAMPGLGTKDEISIFIDEGIKYNTNFVVIQYLSKNDIHSYNDSLLSKKVEKNLQFIQLIFDKKLGYYLYEKLKQKKNRLMYMNLNKDKFDENAIIQLYELKKLSKQFNFTVILTIHSEPNDFELESLNQFNDSFIIINIFEKIPEKNFSEYVLKDHNHPNWKYNEIVAKNLVEVIKKI